MKGKNLWLFVFVICLGLSMGCRKNSARPITATDKPNILFIMADDMGYADLGCFGSTEIETPHLDRLAANGMRLTQFYAGAPICTPTRVAYLTGLFPARFGIDNAFADKKGQYLPDTVMTTAKVLKAAGYFTAHVGKWHMGGIREEDFINRQKGLPADPGPMQHGFDHYLSNIEEQAHRGILYHGDSIFKSAGFHMVRNDSFAPPIDKWWDEIKTDETINLISKCNRENRPFYISLNYFTPHVPYEPPPGDFLAYYLRKGARGYDLLYRSMISHVDQQVGRIMQTLDSLGLSGNTLVIFTSDNGPYVEGNTLGMKGRKFDMHEGGVKVPAIVRWPAKIKAGALSQSPVHITDLLPTLNAVAGLAAPDFACDGMNILEVLTENKQLMDRKPMYWRQVYLKIFPKPDRRRYDTLYTQSTRLNKLISSEGKPEPYSTEAIRLGDWKLYLLKGEPVELVNLATDANEVHNLIDQEKERVEQLMQELKNLNL